MATHMKTTIEISDSLLRRAKTLAAKEGRTLRDVVEQALRDYIQATRRSKGPFRLRRRPFKGRGLQDGISEGRWEDVRRLIYPT